MSTPLLLLWKYCENFMKMLWKCYKNVMKMLWKYYNLVLTSVCNKHYLGKYITGQCKYYILFAITGKNAERDESEESKSESE